ncbi:hypothetical protein Q9233_014595 [Columba guinea]|nr:hypothetical protein Q9233_014595 [Columba guinea]
MLSRPAEGKIMFPDSEARRTAENLLLSSLQVKPEDSLRVTPECLFYARSHSTSNLREHASSYCGAHVICHCKEPFAIRPTKYRCLEYTVRDFTEAIHRYSENRTEGRGEASQFRTPSQSNSCNATDTPLQVPTTALSAGEVPEDTAGPFQ